MEYLGNSVWIKEASDPRYIELSNNAFDKYEGSSLIYIPKDLIGTIKDYIERVEKINAKNN